MEEQHADSIISQMMAAGGSPPQSQLTLEDVFWNATILHTTRVGRPARDKTSAFVTLSCQDIPRIRRILLRWIVLSLFLLPGICSPRLAAIQQCADNTGIVDGHLCSVLISASNERLSVMVELR